MAVWEAANIAVQRAIGINYAAEKKAKKLFYSCLTEKQKIQTKDGYITVIGELTGVEYIIFLTDEPFNIRRVVPVSLFYIQLEEYCIQLKGCPMYDGLLAQKIMIESDEGEFLNIANKRR